MGHCISEVMGENLVLMPPPAVLGVCGDQTRFKYTLLFSNVALMVVR